jgi:release factor glutamine methyltransferase
MRASKLLFTELVAKIEPIYGIDEAKSIIFLLFNQFIGFSKTDVLANKSILQNYDFNPLIERLLADEPVQYIIGNTLFLDNKIVVKQDVTLIPRPETEELVILAIEKLNAMKKPHNKLKVLDIGTGSGCIAISIAKAVDNVEVTSWDISEEALKIAQINAQLNKVEVNFKQENVLEFAENQATIYDLIISNPPYVTHGEKARMEMNVLAYEPHLALFVEDAEPLIFYKKIARLAQKILQKNGLLLFEINENFGQETADCVKNEGFSLVKIIKDIHSKDRILLAQFS